VAVAAVDAGAGGLVVVGPTRAGAAGSGLASVAAGLARGLITVRESPPGAGPVPALARGLAEVSADWIALLAADLPFLTGAWLAEVLAVATRPGYSGAVLVDDTGRPQWLTGCWLTSALRDRLADYRGESLGGLLGPLQPALLAGEQLNHAALRPWADCDEPADLAAARAAAGESLDQDGARPVAGRDGGA